jgi:hypothetical protein
MPWEDRWSKMHRFNTMSTIATMRLLQELTLEML